MCEYDYTHNDDSVAIGLRHDSPLLTSTKGFRKAINRLYPLVAKSKTGAKQSPLNRLDFLVLFGQAKRTRKKYFLFSIVFFNHKGHKVGHKGHKELFSFCKDNINLLYF